MNQIPQDQNHRCAYNAYLAIMLISYYVYLPVLLFIEYNVHIRIVLHVTVVLAILYVYFMTLCVVVRYKLCVLSRSL